MVVLRNFKNKSSIGKGIRICNPGGTANVPLPKLFASAITGKKNIRSGVSKRFISPIFCL